MHAQNSAPAGLSTTGSSRHRKWNVDRHPGRRTGLVLVVVLLLLVAAETSTEERRRRRQQRSYHRYAGEHIHVGVMSDCPVRPPCYCTDSVTTTTQRTAAARPAITEDDQSSRWTAPDHDVVVVVAQRIACDSFSDVRRRRGKSRSRSRSGSRPGSLRRFPRFVESNVAVERHVLLSYSGLTSIPGAAFHAIKVRPSARSPSPMARRDAAQQSHFQRRIRSLSDHSASENAVALRPSD